MTLISIEECRRFFRERLISTGHEADWNALFEETIYRSALLRPEGEELSFRHHLLQEFFAGRGVPDVTFFQNIVVDDWWKNPLIFYFGENPTKHNELMKLIKSFENCEADELYRAAVAVGLAVQACYLSRVQDKNASMDWVISGLARAKESFLAMIDKGIPNRPVMAFVNYYLFARDSVACKSLSDHSADVARQDLQAKNLTPIRECEIFWRIVSLIESGQFNVAKELVKKFHPSDGRYLLALHLGCFLISNLNTYSNEDRKTAEQVASIIAPHIPHLRMQVLKEFTSMLLEVRKGKISVVQVITREDKSLEE
jgi:hypothetical protein